MAAALHMNDLIQAAKKPRFQWRPAEADIATSLKIKCPFSAPQNLSHTMVTSDCGFPLDDAVDCGVVGSQESGVRSTALGSHSILKDLDVEIHWPLGGGFAADPLIPRRHGPRCENVLHETLAAFSFGISFAGSGSSYFIHAYLLRI